MSKGSAHRLELLQKWEPKLNPAQLELWRTLMSLLSQDSNLVGTRGGYGLECFLMGKVMRNVPLEELRRFIPNARHGDRRQVDRRAAASGDRDAA